MIEPVIDHGDVDRIVDDSGATLPHYDRNSAPQEGARSTYAYTQATSSWVEIDRAALEHNLTAYKNIVTPALFAPVIKGNAYGHGLEVVAQVCQQSSAVDMLCVVSTNEALVLRMLGITKPIFVLSIVLDHLKASIEHDIEVCVYNVATATHLNTIARSLNKKVVVHVKIDTGLSRLGLRVEDAVSCIQELLLLSHLVIKGIFTHLADSECADTSFAHHQLAQFDAVLAALEMRGITIPLRHTSCSAAATAHRPSHHTMVRSGIGIYGLWPSQENRLITQQYHPTFSLKPAMSWKTSIIHVQQVPAHSFIGYDRTHQVQHAATVATIPVGYWDGYDRELSNRGCVLVRGVLAPIIGRVCMNLTMIDVTNLAAQVGDEVTLLGNHEGITADDLARHCNTINYEVVTRINPLLPRVMP